MIVNLNFFLTQFSVISWLPEFLLSLQAELITSTPSMRSY